MAVVPLPPPINTVFQSRAVTPVMVRVATSSTVKFTVVPSASRSIVNLCQPAARTPPEALVAQFIQPIVADG